MPFLKGRVIASAAALGAWIVQRGIRRRFEAADQEAPFGAVIPGAEPLHLSGGPRGVLILHGFGDTPQSIRELATSLNGDGWTVRAPLLRGHGASVRDLTAGRAASWIHDAEAALAELRTEVPSVALIGQSMGGALATILASRVDVGAMALLVPYLRMSPRAARIARLHRIVTPFVPYLESRSESSILDADARARALGRGITTPRLLHELSLVVHQAWSAAPQVRVPTLVLSSRQDPRIGADDAKSGFERLGSEEKVQRWAERSGHVLSVDYERAWVAKEVREWLNRHLASSAPPGHEPA